jgi:hypothetical protein
MWVRWSFRFTKTFERELLAPWVVDDADLQMVRGRRQRVDAPSIACGVRANVFPGGPQRLEQA